MIKKDLTGKLVYGFGGFSGLTPCIYRDKGWYEDTKPEYNVRKVEEVKLLEDLEWNHPLLSTASSGESYGCHMGGGCSGLYEISEEHVQQLISENDKLAAEKLLAYRQKEASEKAEREEEKKRKEHLRESLNVKCEILKHTKGTPGEGGVDESALVKLTDLETGESLKFNCRNVFDFGYVINPNYSIAPGIEGGLDSNGYWQDFDNNKGWYNIRELTDFEKRCLNYLREFPPVYSGIRM